MNFWFAYIQLTFYNHPLPSHTHTHTHTQPSPVVKGIDFSMITWISSSQMSKSVYSCYKDPYFFMSAGEICL